MKVPTHVCWMLATLIFAGSTVLYLGCDEAVERALCGSVSQKICEKWFDCYPLVSTGWWGNVSDCRVVMQANCSNSEVLYGCDLDNSDLTQCDNEIGDSTCGSLPPSCEAMVDCYY